MPEQRPITNEEQRSILYTSETPGFRLLCDILQAEIDNTLGVLENFSLTAAEETRYLAYFRAYRRILFILLARPRDIQLALRRDVDPTTTQALFTPGISEQLDVVGAEWDQWSEENDPLAPKNGNNSNVVVE